MVHYPWLKTIYNKILMSYYLNKGHHALILSSKQNYGEDILIYKIAQWLMCNNRLEMQFCGVCDNCILMSTKNHPDYYQLNINNDIQSIGVDTIRTCTNALYVSPKCSFVKIVFIKNLENLTYQASSILLKTIEEPPVNTYFFLSTNNDMIIPLTLSSRCIKWTLLPPIEEQGLIWLMQKQKEIDFLSAQTALRLSNGSPIEAEYMFQSNSWKDRIKLCQIIQDIIMNKNFLTLLPLLLINTKEYNDKVLYWLITILMDSLKWQHKIHKKFLINSDQLNLISSIAIRWNMLSLNQQVNQWLILSNYFKKFNNVNYNLLLMYRLLNWKLGIVETYLF